MNCAPRYPPEREEGTGSMFVINARESDRRVARAARGLTQVELAKHEDAIDDLDEYPLGSGDDSELSLASNSLAPWGSPISRSSASASATRAA